MTWGELRQRLSVSDAPHTPRELSGVPFDLQLQRTVRRRPNEDSRVIEGLPQQPPPPWARALAAEALSPDGLYQFLKRWGPQLHPERESVMRADHLVASSHRSKSAAGRRANDHLLAHWFPAPNDARGLKASLLAPGQARDGGRLWLDETALLAGLLAAPSLDAFSPDDLALTPRLSAILTTTPGALIVLGKPLEHTPTPLGKAVVDEVLSRLTAEQIAGLVKAAPEIMVRLSRDSNRPPARPFGRPLMKSKPGRPSVACAARPGA